VDTASLSAPALDYLVDAFRRGQDPGPLFDGADYLERYPDCEWPG
jgi:hypothetical protein